MKTIFITGASAGLGKATAKLFQSKGWKVIATMRHPEKETELSGLENLILLPLDITNTEQIDHSVKQALSSGSIDVVFNNAGYGLVGALEYYSDEQIVKQIETNLTGVLRVTKAFIPYFKEKRNGLFITTTSIFGYSSCPLSSVYNATKWALEGWSESISCDLTLFNIGIKTVAPGGIKSNFINAMQTAESKGYEPINDRINGLIANGHLFSFNDVEDIATVVYEAATDNKDQLRYIAGEDAARTGRERTEKGRENFRKDMTLLLNLKPALQNEKN